MRCLLRHLLGLTAVLALLTALTASPASAASLAEAGSGVAGRSACDAEVCIHLKSVPPPILRVHVVAMPPGVRCGRFVIQVWSYGGTVTRYSPTICGQRPGADFTVYTPARHGAVTAQFASQPPTP